MATGITKREQHSEDSISALDLYREPTSLPPEDAEVALSYPNKAQPSDIITQTQHRLLTLDGGVSEEVTDLPVDAFILDDNFFVLNELIRQDKKVDLFYLDPPYGTGFDFQSRNLEHAYEDKMGLAPYIEFMRRRLILMRETMSHDGSIYVHIGHQMLAHLKVIMDEVFGPDNFRNLITRRKCSSKNFTRKQYANIHDYILFYTKSKSYKWNQPGVEPDQDWIEREYPKIDHFGRRYKLVPVHAPGTRNGETGQPWRGLLPPPGKHWQYAPAKLDELDRNGDIHWSRNGNPRRKVYFPPDKKKTRTDYWDQYRDAHHQSIKITGYPTEKNLSMIKMIVGASSEEGDLVVDPFCGSGTVLHAAQSLGRRYLGIDSSFGAAKATLTRMRHGLEPMGDYVSSTTKSTQQRTLDFPRVSAKPCCRFLVDRQIFETYSGDLNEISEI